jgi:hypothetical protein
MWDPVSPFSGNFLDAVVWVAEVIETLLVNSERGHVFQSDAWQQELTWGGLFRMIRHNMTMFLTLISGISSTFGYGGRSKRFSNLLATLPAPILVIMSTDKVVQDECHPDTSAILTPNLCHFYPMYISG